MSHFFCLWVDEEEMHLEESEEGLEDGVGDQDVVHAGGLHGGVHGNLETGEDQGAQAKNWKKIIRVNNGRDKCDCDKC